MTQTAMAETLDGHRFPLADVTCCRCGNSFHVIAEREHTPSYCCYCGTRFGGYVDEDGIKDLGGRLLYDDDLHD